MPPSESRHEQIAARLQTIFAAVVAGNTYWYTPAAVLRVDGFWSEYFDGGAIKKVDGTQTLILLRPGDERRIEDTDREVKHEMDVWLCIAQVYEAQVTQDPYLIPGTLPWTIQSRLIQDVETVQLSASLQSGFPMGLSFVENLEMPDINRQFYVGESFIAAEMRLMITYTNEGTTV